MAGAPGINSTIHRQGHKRFNQISYTGINSGLLPHSIIKEQWLVMNLTFASFGVSLTANHCV